MSKRHRVTARKPPGQDPSKPLTILFSDLVIGSTDKTVELESCIPFSKIRPLSSSGVQRLMSSFLGDGKSHTSLSEDVFHTSGFSLGSDIPMVVKLEGPLRHYVYEHFKAENVKGTELEERIKSRKEWFGIVDGLHSHAALSIIKNNNTQWTEFKWYVKVLNGGHPIEKYRQLGRVQNARHHPYFYVELTLFDVLYNLRVEHETLKRDQKKCGGSETAHAYDGAQHAKNSTLQQKANIAIRLPFAVVEELGKIMNLDRPDIKLKHNSISKNSSRTETQLMQQEDCRIFRRFININTLKGSSVFMNAKGEGAQDVQISALHRAKDLYIHSSLKAIKADELTSQFKLSNLAHMEQRKFLRFIESKSWPTEMSDLKENLLNTTMFDKDLEENSNNDLSILSHLLDAYRRHFPDIAVLKEAKWQASIESDETNNPEATEEGNKTSTNEEPKVDNDTKKVQTNATEHSEPQVAEVNDSDEILHITEIDEDAPLKEKNITGYNMTWSRYLRDKRTDSSPRFDLLITRPPYAASRSFIKSVRQNVISEDISKEEIEQFCMFTKRVMKSAGYIVLLVHFTMFREWYEALDSHGILVMPEEFIITYNPATVKRRKLIHFTQSAHDVALIAKIPGSHPEGFMPPFYQNGEEDSKWTKFHSLLTNVPALKSFLTRDDSKVPFDTREFNPDVYQEFIEIFTPMNGTVIDPFSRTMTAGLACIRSRRSCHLIENSSDCFKAAMKRLRKAATPLPSFDAVASLTFTSVPISDQSLSDENQNGDAEGVDLKSSSSSHNGSKCPSGEEDTTASCPKNDIENASGDSVVDIRENKEVSESRESTISAHVTNDKPAETSKEAISSCSTVHKEGDIKRALRKRLKTLHR